MNPRVLTAVSAWFSLLVPSQACGPFFPDTVLDYPTSVLAAPSFSYLHELCRISGRPLPVENTYDSTRREPESPFIHQIPLEEAELLAVWEREGVAAEVIQERIDDYGRVRRLLLAPLLEASSAMSFPTHGDHPPGLPVRPLGPEFPPDIADYVEAARLHATGDTAAARTLWKGILDRPPAERRLRAAWAAWMLAKTSPDPDECLSWYERIETEIDAGASDAIGLGSAAKAWRAGFALQPGRMKDPVKMMHFLYEAFVNGKNEASIDLRKVSRVILDSDDETLRAAAADPLVRRLINLELISHVRRSAGTASPISRWPAIVKAASPSGQDDMSRVACALYAAGRYEEALEFLSACPKEDSLALWLQAKFDLRDGNLALANKHLSACIRIQSRKDGWNPAPASQYNPRWFTNAAMIERRSQAELFADSAVVSMALKDYLAALESLRKGNYEADAAYLVENIIDLDGLIRHVRRVAPQWTPVKTDSSQEEPSLDDYRDPWAYTIGVDNQLRYQLARRLARERRFKDAREFMPAPLVPTLDRYAKLDKARVSGRYSGETLAAITWNQALMHREFGTRLFATDGAPDGALHGFRYPITGVQEGRSRLAGWELRSGDLSNVPSTEPGLRAIPLVTAHELARLEKNSVTPMERYHYRYVAADLVWEATRSLSPNHPHLASMYTIAGGWLANRDPGAADRFYQALVRRCAETEQGKAAEAKRWFPHNIARLGELPLPDELQPEETAANP